jgi:hypothetical protein
LYASGHFLNVKMTEVQVLPINLSVLFLEERNVIITSDVWRVAIDLDTKVHKDAIATVRNDLTSVDKQKKFTPVAELKQVGNLLNTL